MTDINMVEAQVVMEELKSINKTVEETGVSANTIRNYIKGNKVYYEKVETLNGLEYRVYPSEIRTVYEGKGAKHKGGMVTTDQAAMLEAVFTQQSARLEEVINNQTAMLTSRVEEVVKEATNQPDSRIEELLNKVDSLQQQLANIEARQVKKGFRWPWQRDQAK